MTGGVNEILDKLRKLRNAAISVNYYFWARILCLGGLEIYDLVTLGQDLLMLVPYNSLDEANPSRPMDDSSRGFQMIPRRTRR